MIGKAGGRRFTCGCCDWSKGKRGVKADEERLAFKEADEEINDPHAEGLCNNPVTGGVGCYMCYGEDYDHYDNSDLEGIHGVWCNVDWRD